VKLDVLRVRGWSKHFENNRTRELKKLDWVPIPNKHDGDGFSELLEHANGMAHYGAWTLIVQVASKCDERGTLLRDGAKAYDARSLARVTRGSQKVFDEAIPRLLEIGWLERISVEVQGDAENPATGCGNPATGCTEGKGREGKNIKRLHGIPHSVEDVIAYGRQCNPIVPEQTCRKFWSHYEGQARTNPNGDVFWITSSDAVVTNWKAKLPSFSEPRSVSAKPVTAARPYSPNI
jgi:hypothetical protein